MFFKSLHVAVERFFLCDVLKSNLDYNQTVGLQIKTNIIIHTETNKLKTKGY